MFGLERFSIRFTIAELGRTIQYPEPTITASRGQAGNDGIKHVRSETALSRPTNVIARSGASNQGQEMPETCANMRSKHSSIRRRFDLSLCLFARRRNHRVTLAHWLLGYVSEFEIPDLGKFAGVWRHRQILARRGSDHRGGADV